MFFLKAKWDNVITAIRGKNKMLVEYSTQCYWEMIHRKTVKLQFSSVTQSCLTLYDPMDCSTPGFPVHRQFRSLLKLLSIEPVMPSNHLVLCRPLLLLPSIFPSIRVFSRQSVLCIRGQTTGVSASVSVLPMNIHDWFPFGWTGWISLQYKVFSRVFSNTTVQKHQFFSTQLSL